MRNFVLFRVDHFWPLEGKGVWVIWFGLEVLDHYGKLSTLLIITFCGVIALSVRKVITICVERLHFALNILLHFALVLHFAAILITFCVNIPFCGDYYILRRNSSQSPLHLSLHKGESLQRYSLNRSAVWLRGKQLENFHMRALRSILDMRWQDRITNLEVLDPAECTGTGALLIKPSCGGCEWTILACPVNCCMEILRLARESKAARASGTRTLGRETFVSAASSWKNLRLQTVTEVNVAHRPTEPLPVWRTTAVKD